MRRRRRRNGCGTVKPASTVVGPPRRRRRTTHSSALASVGASPGSTSPTARWPSSGAAPPASAFTRSGSWPALLRPVGPERRLATWGPSHPRHLRDQASCQGPCPPRPRRTTTIPNASPCPAGAEEGFPSLRVRSSRRASALSSNRPRQRPIDYVTRCIRFFSGFTKARRATAPMRDVHTKRVK